MRVIHVRSAPAQNAGPAPASTTTRTSSSSAIVLGPDRQLRDDRFVERVADVGPIQREVFDRTVAARM